MHGVGKEESHPQQKWDHVPSQAGSYDERCLVLQVRVITGKVLQTVFGGRERESSVVESYLWKRIDSAQEKIMGPLGDSSFLW